MTKTLDEKCREELERFVAHYSQRDRVTHLGNGEVLRHYVRAKALVPHAIAKQEATK